VAKIHWGHVLQCLVGNESKDILFLVHTAHYVSLSFNFEIYLNILLLIIYSLNNTNDIIILRFSNFSLKNENNNNVRSPPIVGNSSLIYNIVFHNMNFQGFSNYYICHNLMPNICNNGHHILYIIMDETTKFTSNVSLGTTFYMRKNYILLYC